MDLITLAMAKAYTDEKVSGGGGGSGLPMVELSTPLSSGVKLTDEETASVVAALETGMPVILLGLVDGLPARIVAGNIGGMMLGADFYVARLVISADGNVSAMT